jgi:hypothetical protein
MVFTSIFAVRLRNDVADKRAAHVSTTARGQASEFHYQQLPHQNHELMYWLCHYAMMNNNRSLNG